MLPLCCPGTTRQIYPQVCRSWKPMAPSVSNRMPSQASFSLKAMGSDLLGLKIANKRGRAAFHWSFLGGSTIAIHSVPRRYAHFQKLFSPSASWVMSSQIASSAFTFGTIAVLPFYSLMVLAPNSNLTKRSMESSTPYVILGILYAYLLYLSWTPDTIRFMFASKYWLPELPGIAKMFSNEMTLASAWIHLLVVDLFAARQIFHDGLKNEIETRHSVSLCLLFCPVGILAHALTKVLTKKTDHAD